MGLIIVQIYLNIAIAVSKSILRGIILPLFVQLVVVVSLIICTF